MDIEVKLDEYADINSFYENIFSEKFISRWGFVKKRIFSWYRELEKKLNNIKETETRKKIIHDYIHDVYTNNYRKIQVITQDLKFLFEKNKEKIIKGLSKTMDFDPKSIPHITITPTLKPNSTFWTKTINLSIASELFKNEKKPYIDIFIHEISHTIREQKIWKVYDSIGKLWSFAHDMLKEIVAPIIIRDECFKDIRQSKGIKEANEEQQLLQISINWTQHNIVDYFESLYQDMKAKWNSFENIMKTFVSLFLKIEDQISAKHMLYEEIRTNSHNKEEVSKYLKEKWYRNPIILA